MTTRKPAPLRLVEGNGDNHSVEPPEAFTATAIDPVFGWEPSVKGDPEAIKAIQQLNAAAPELYEALDEFVSQDGCHCSHPACKRCERTRDALSALAHARGEEPLP